MVLHGCNGLLYGVITPCGVVVHHVNELSRLVGRIASDYDQ